MSLYVEAVKRGMPEGLSGDEQAMWWYRRDQQHQFAIKRLRNANARLQKQNALLIATLDRLPKTRDGAYVVPGMPVYLLRDERYIQNDLHVSSSPPSQPCVTYSWYSSREAAEKANEERCPYCNSDNSAVRETYFDQTCKGCVDRFSSLAVTQKHISEGDGE